METGKKLTFRVSQDLYNSLVKLCLLKHKGINGFMNMEGVEALKKHLDNEWKELERKGLKI